MKQQFAVSWKTVLCFFAIALGILLIYFPVLTGEFLLDDHVLIENNSFIRDFSSLNQFFIQEDGVPEPSQWPHDYHTGYYRPLVSLSYALDYRLWGNTPLAYHATNLFLHLAVCLALFTFLRRHVTDDLTSLVAVLVFALHPVNTEAVAWISSRNNLMSTLFSLLSVHLYAGRSRGGYLLAIICFALALFSKEYGVMVFPLLFLWNRTLGAGRLSWKKELTGYIPFVGVLIWYFYLRTVVTGAVISPSAGISLWARLAMVPYLVVYNLRLIFFPVGLHSFSVSYPKAGDWGDVALGVIGLALFFILIWRYRREKPLLMGSVGFLIGLFPVLNIVPTSAVSLVSMRWLYFPMAFFTIAWCRPLSVLLRKPIHIWILAVSIAALGGYTAYLNRFQWHDDAVFFEREVLGFDNLSYAGGLADTLHSRGEYLIAEVYYQQGIVARPELVNTYIGYAALLIDTGRPEKALAVLDSIADRIMSRENRGRLQSNRAMAMMRLAKTAQAIKLFEEAVTLAPSEPSFWGNLGSAYGRVGDYPRSANALEKGLALAPDSVGLIANLVLTRLNMKDLDGARRAFQRLPDDEQKKRPDIAAMINHPQ